MKVKAKDRGQYKGEMFSPGEFFEIEVGAGYPAPWMEPVLEPVVEAPVIEKKEEVKNKEVRWSK